MAQPISDDLDEWDVYTYFRIIETFWDEVFASTLDPWVLHWIRALGQFRHRLAHESERKRITLDNIIGALDTAATCSTRSARMSGLRNSTADVANSCTGRLTTRRARPLPKSYIRHRPVAAHRDKEPMPNGFSLA
jgi:hypothetical protein